MPVPPSATLDDWACIFQQFHALWGHCSRGGPYDKHAWSQLNERLQQRAADEGYFSGRPDAPGGPTGAR